MQCGRLVDQPSRIPAIVKITGSILHVIDCPVCHFQRQRQRFRIAIAKENQGINRLRTTLDVERQCLVVIVSWGAIRQKERGLLISVPGREIRLELAVGSALSIVFDRV